MKLTKSQTLILKELYEKTLVYPNKYFVWTKWVDYRTICALYKIGLIESSYVKNNLPTNMKLTPQGVIYCETVFSV